MTVTTRPGAAAQSHIKPSLLIGGTFLTKDIKRARRMFEEVLNLECVEPEKDLLLIREKGHKPGEALHGQPYWVLEAREVADIAVPQEMLNHWGVAVPSQAAVDEAFAHISAKQKEYGIARVQKPRFRHGSYALYFVDADSNWRQVEYRTPDLLYTTLRQKGDQH